MENRFGDTVVGTTGNYVGTINNISQGTGETQRIGRKVIIRSLSLRGEVKMPNEANTVLNAASINCDVVRLMIVQDKQTNGNVANLTDIFSYNFSSGSPVVDWRAFRTMDNINRFKILVDKTFKINNQIFTAGGGSAPLNEIAYNIYRKCYIPIEMKGSTANVADMMSNSVSIYLVSGNGLATWNGIARVRFSDEG